MPKSAPSSFKGGGGILRGVDGVIQDVQFELYKPKDPKKQTIINGVLTVLPDGADEPIETFGIFVGAEKDFTITNEGRALEGPNEFGRSTEWYTLLASLVEALKTAGIEESDFFVQEEGSETADYSCLINQRVRFDWRKNAQKTAKLGKRPNKQDASKPGFDREDLIITAYYGEVEPTPVKAVVKSKPAPGAKTVTKAAGGKPNGKAVEVNIGELASSKVVAALKSVKDGKLLKSKLSVKLLTGMAKEPEYREEVRTWAKDDDNLAGIVGVSYDPASQTLTLDATE